ncbi:hypothetical protein [Mycolicibacterium fortuitum]|uniref:hypothetical protein n=1 Tax=Mycolicibacterium fortuitum TaxID=1766 RepID=UPI001AEFBD93|nr:hypothetical protein [Mycolicibacterium fortuitum]MBP3086954.1 hypothetical protein [Mycolicibacterium fortuitum]
MSCEWPVDRTCLPDLPVLGDDPTTAEQAAYDAAVAQRNSAENIAIQVLWSLSGRQFGVCETTARPCPTYAQGFGYGPFVLMLDSGHWTNWPCGCIGSCSVTGPRVVHLPGPVDAITVVTIDGVPLDQADYQLEGNALYRKGGQWPRQDLGRPLGESGTWSVTYTRGIPVPPGVDKLTGQLAREFAAACDDEDECRLPRTLVATTRRGVSHEFDPSKILAAGKTGLTEVDLWLSSVNPHGLQQNAEVL